MMMPEFYIEVELGRGLTRVQVEPVPPAGWAMPGCPQFLIEYFTGQHFLALTLQLEGSNWYDLENLLSGDDLRRIGNLISNYMVVALNDYMGLFMPQYRTPTLN